jgi:hypothetical protein
MMFYAFENAGKRNFGFTPLFGIRRTKVVRRRELQRFSLACGKQGLMAWTQRFML